MFEAIGGGWVVVGQCDALAEANWSERADIDGRGRRRVEAAMHQEHSDQAPLIDSRDGVDQRHRSVRRRLVAGTLDGEPQHCALS